LASKSDLKPPSEHVEEEILSNVQLGVIDLFVRGVKVLGLPKSIGEIYGLLYISPDPLALDAIVSKLGISKGSASQGLRFLRNLGAVETVTIPDERREHFEAVAQLKPLATGFIRGELLPHLESGTTDLDALTELAKTDESADAEFNLDRVERLQKWSSRGRTLLKIVEKFVR
jgi:DNA-binding transcriptional regulator GbsR (MarR family)